MERKITKKILYTILANIRADQAKDNLLLSPQDFYQNIISAEALPAVKMHMAVDVNKIHRSMEEGINKVS